MIKAKEVTLHDLLGKDKRLQIRVPDYQRGYSWDSVNVQDFFRDVTIYFDSAAGRKTNAMYFLGPIVLMPGPQSDTYSYIVDGQQRIATSVMFLAVLRDLSNELFGLQGLSLANEIHNTYLDSVGPNEGQRYSVLLGDLDQPFFSAFVQKRDRVENQVPRNKSNGRLKTARTLLEKNVREKISSMENKLEYVERIFQSICQRVVMIAIDVDGEREAMNVFERINVRGKPLSEADLIRHRLISSSPANERARVRGYWDELEKLLGTDGPQMDVFLHHMWISRNGDIAASKLYDEISNYLDMRNLSPLEFAEECVNDCRIYSVLLNKDDNLLHHESRSCVWAIHTTFGIKNALPLLLSAYRKFEKTPGFSKLVFAIEALIVRHLVFAGLDIRMLLSTFNEVALLVEEATTKEEATSIALRKLSSINPTSAEMLTGVRRQMVLKKLQALYVLRQLEGHFSHPDGALMAAATLEHIFPQSASPPRWSAPRVDRLTPYLNHLGNLALLAGQHNSSAGNKSFSQKKAIYRDSSLKLTSEIAEENTTWGRAQIIRRCERLARLADTRWQVR